MVDWPRKAKSWPLFLSRHCAKAAWLVSESVDRRLSWRERAKLSLHLAFCSLSARHQREAAWMRRLLRQDAEQKAGRADDPTTTLSEEARQRIKNTLRKFLKKGNDPSWK
jgi:hypothetical protein